MDRIRKECAYIGSSAAMLVGTLLFVASLPLYVSYSSRAVMDRWSYPHFALLASSVLAWLILLIALIRASRRDSFVSSVAGRLFAFAVLCWGVAYFVSALDSPTAAGRALELNFVGSDHPVAAILELCALWLAFIAAAIFIAGRVPRKLQNAGLVVATIATMLMLGETFVRVRSVLAPSTQGFPTYSGALWSRRYVEYDSLGFRDVEHVVDGNDKERLLVVGDSFAFGVGVKNIEDRFGEITAKLLTDSDDTAWEPINAGRGDTHTLDHIAFLERMLEFHPDVVVLLYVFNDIDYLASTTPRSSLLGGGWTRVLKPDRILYLNSYLFQELYVRLRSLRFMWNPASVESDPYLNSDLLDRHLADVSRFVEIARASGAAVWILPYSIYMESDDVANAQYAAFVTAAEKLGLPICDMRGVFKDVPPASLRVNSLDGHPNPKANRLAAARGAQCIRSRFPS